MIKCEIGQGRKKQVEKYPYVGKCIQSGLVVLFTRFSYGIVLDNSEIKDYFKEANSIGSRFYYNENNFEWVDELIIRSI